MSVSPQHRGNNHPPSPSYTGGSFRRASAAGLPSNRVAPAMDQYEEQNADDMQWDQGGYHDGDIPFVEAQAIPAEAFNSKGTFAQAPQDQDEDPDFEMFMAKQGRSASKSSKRSKRAEPPPSQPRSQPSFKGPVSGAEQRRASFQATPFANPSGNAHITPNPSKAWPAALRQRIVDKLRNGVVDGATADKFLAKYNWPKGLRDTIVRSCAKLPLRFFLVDDSGSMIINDGKRLVQQGPTPANCRMVKCTRWAELSETMFFLAELSESLQVVSDFRLLNGSDPVLVGLGEDHGESLKFLREVLSESPAGPTPLCQHIERIVQCILSVEDVLRANGQKAVVMIATDGESSDGNVAEALRPLTHLPVLVILRLCTEEDAVVEYWNNIDNQLELDIDVLDDLVGDAKQVAVANGWLTYAEPLHRMREFGASMKEMDILDESTLSCDQMRVVCAYLFSINNVKDIPHPGVDWRGFVAKIKELNAREGRVYDPVTQKAKPWVDVSLLRRFYPAEAQTGSSTCTIS